MDFRRHGCGSRSLDGTANMWAASITETSFRTNRRLHLTPQYPPSAGQHTEPNHELYKIGDYSLFWTARTGCRIPGDYLV